MAVNRINEFLEAVKTSTDLKTLVDTELEYLDNELTLSSKKRALTRYRNAIRSALGVESEVLKIFKLTREESNDLKLADKIQIRNTSDNQVALNLETFLNVAIGLIADRKSYTKVAVGLFALTGRRPIEILKTAIFTPVSNDWLTFEGQAKKSKSSNDLESKPYDIPILTDSTDIVEALNFIRSVRDFSDISNDDIHSKTNKTLNETCKRCFKGVIPDPSPKMLRKAYGEVASHWFKPDSQEKNAFLSDILGHETLDIATSQTYKQFYIDD
jgi:hypothetical protein